MTTTSGTRTRPHPPEWWCRAVWERWTAQIRWTGFCCPSALPAPRTNRVVHWLEEEPEAPASSPSEEEDRAAVPAVVVEDPTAPWNKKESAEKEPQDVPKRRRVLLEIVGAMGLATKKRETVDPFVKVQVWDDSLKNLKVLHRTDTIKNDGNPIWTAKTKSLCLLDIPLLSTDTTTTTVTTSASSSLSTSTDTEHHSAVPDVRTSILLDICHGSTRLGRVPISFHEILQHCENKDTREEERLEYKLEPGAVDHAVIAVRFRTATERDILFMEKLKRLSMFSKTSVRDISVTSPNQGIVQLSPIERRVASDINFTSVKHKSFLQRHRKTDSSGQDVFRVLPYPDPDSPESTMWMTKQEINHMAHQPSSKWVTAGCGRAGTLHLEIMGCDKLPQLDTDINGDVTDPFCIVCFEDSMLRTDVIWDSLSPRWPPWSTRAFEFAVRHPASLLCLAVFDYDVTPVDEHDPIGRIVLRPDNFKSSLTYTLHYALQDDPQIHVDAASTMMDAPNVELKATSTPRGTITIRLRVEWDEDVMKLYRSPPPQFIINVDNAQSYRVLCYVTRGAVFMDEANIRTCKLLASEVIGYWSSYCYVVDVVVEKLLWRGRLRVSDRRSIWFPIHSVLLFTAAVTVVEYPQLALPVFLYLLAWIMLTINYHACRRPYPWKRVQSSLETSLSIVFGRKSVLASSLYQETGQADEIPPNAGTVEGAQLEILDALKAARMSALILYTLQFMLKAYRIYSKTGDYAIKITTDTHSWSALNFLSGKLYYLHMMLKMLVKYLRLGRDFVSWKSRYTAVITTRCILLVSAWLVLPMNTILRWILRLFICSLLGPWMKLIDVRYFRPWYETKEELLERIRNGKHGEEPGLPNFESILDNETFRKMTKAGRMKAEELYKLRDMRTLVYGPYSEYMPVADNSRYPAIPLPASTAVRTALVDQTPGRLRGYHVPGQLLCGHMVHSRFTEPPDEIGALEITSSSESDDDKKFK